MSKNTEVVDAFVDSWKDKDVDRILSFFHDDAVYTNIPIDPPNQGIEAIRKVIQAFVAMSAAIEWIVHNTSENPETGVVMNERTDRFKLGDKWVEAKVMGVFELKDGKIRDWRDYFDLAQFQNQLGS